ncbi:Uncharacterised protein [Salmonella enterica subsp. enterica]|uniref:Uncharacterized protein n=1 Tax=Salmonella enterica I TaxID=59201 RepID=A0A379WM90_SALET|nr:Uncharacterised protein [Salmonella enterica subsp. enterica]VEA17906.1 Uncharacterised protein [Salmonella enterica subsp. enterica]
MIFFEHIFKRAFIIFHGFSFCVAITIIMTVNFMLKNNPAIICFLAYLIRRKRQQA